MTEKKCKSLKELEDEVEKIKQRVLGCFNDFPSVPAPVLFRGQANSEWKLESTLERYVSGHRYSVDEYNRVLCAIAPAISAFTEKEWSLSTEDYEIDFVTKLPPNCEFMSYVRHHGFPTPLIDWTQSLYVALFFAFQNAQKDCDVAIYCYYEYLDSGKSGTVGNPEIVNVGPYINSHKRHFAQQGQYTFAVEKSLKQWRYCSHEDALRMVFTPGQDSIHKLVLPGNLKKEVLEKLNEMNINAFTLYASEDALMDSLAFKEITLKNK
ncbi:FRG domain-containing protein [Shewanella maritima]|uniref:FRG domain-containing protein n=1 Tax=Shewanella maritima TaxID=2520507 RepID=UPI003735D099